MPPAQMREALLRLLADSAWHALDSLARALVVNAAELEQHLSWLGSAGVPVLRRGGACRLPWPLELLDQTQLAGLLEASSPVPPTCVQVLWRPASTSDVARRVLADAAIDAPVVIFAESQETGRGRRGRAWLAPPGLNLCVSVGWRLPLAPGRLAGLSLAVGVQLARWLQDAKCPGVQLKWPNDVLVNGAKLAGVLVEVDDLRHPRPAIVIGVGLNLRVPGSLVAQAGQPAIGLLDVSPAMPGRNALAAGLAAQLIIALQRFSDAGFGTFAADWTELDALAGRELAVSTATGSWAGTGAGVDDRGALRVRRTDGSTAVVDSADVSVRPT